MNRQFNRWALALAVAVALAGPAQAQTGDQAQASPAVSGNTTVHLIRLLVEQGVITEEQAGALMEQARRDARAEQEAREPDVREGDVRVPYIPETVRDGIRAEVKEEVITQAKEENWAAPNTFPEWVSRVEWFGDVRVRNESRFRANDNSDLVADYQEWNDTEYDISVPNVFPPLLNTRQDRENLLRVRARFGLEADLGKHWRTGLRLATGSSDSPVSTTQTLGGGLSKKEIWLDRAWISWHPGIWTFTAGRAKSPFVSTDILYSGELGFDGVSAGWNGVSVGEHGAFFGTLGAFPLGYISDDFPSDEQNKKASEDKWLLGAQLGIDWRFQEDQRFLAALAYYDFNNIEGQRSSPCPLYAGYQSCRSDWSAPAFMQKGNSVFLLRDIVLEPGNEADTAMPQLVGLASEFQLLDINLRWRTPLFNDYELSLAGNYIHNLAYDEDEMFERSDGLILNNFDTNGELESGADAWMVHAAFGDDLDLARAGNWQVFFGYKYIEPDALPDAFNDSSFHLGGTNAKGYFLGGSYAFTPDLSARGRWLSAEEVYGQPLAIDVLQLELNARF
ncbi:putative porin [Alloalcanivorax marinus]|uniref:putative porin n=1 Tax=Alloalcanivorax marinus TaxID=1177169 RepID=UPI0019349802|nr:putative porin [Alloalcanivorax marinus]MBL7252533.1 putative porin [Alloalcanivorax marinus]